MSAARPPHQRTMTSCRKAEQFTRAKDVAGIYALVWEGMRIKTVDMDLIYPGGNVKDAFDAELLEESSQHERTGKM